MAETLPTPPFGHPSREGRKPAKIIRYKPYLKKLAHKLRKNMTFGEVILWQHLKRKQMNGYDFDRQRPINGFIVDFYCKELMLAIEIDGSSHDSETAQWNDQLRQQRLEALGVRFLRFRDETVRHQTQVVLDSIRTWISNHPPKDPLQGRGGAQRRGG